ncbi:predicted protein [Histoplasma capsulatum var. duboisii H88]|uniref:Predicted protein n=1 Tax=Ajellomyces capsulatus (strain H88) TaxID=544711 RepID=F0URT2_AJEC8|nr:predicted protein [Histoplasma capsulatum var. duboisii H88]
MAGGLRMQPPLFRAGWRAFRGHLGLNDQHHQRIATSRRPISPQSLPDTAIGVSKLIHQQTCHGQKAGNSLEHCLWFTQTAAYRTPLLHSTAQLISLLGSRPRILRQDQHCRPLTNSLGPSFGEGSNNLDTL